jgi:hypothetical protein
MSIITNKMVLAEVFNCSLRGLPDLCRLHINLGNDHVIELTVSEDQPLSVHLVVAGAENPPRKVSQTIDSFIEFIDEAFEPQQPEPQPEPRRSIHE